MYLDKRFECRKVTKDNASVILQDMKKFTPKNPRNTFVGDDLKRNFINYLGGSIVGYSNYYVIYFEETPMLFFSLQAGSVFYTGIADSKVRELILSVEAASTVTGPGGHKRLDKKAFLAALDSFDISEAVETTNINEVTELLKNVQALQDAAISKEAVQFVYPCFELVSFCRNNSPSCLTKWSSLNIAMSMGAYFFWMYIAVILYKASNIIGCRYISLYAADVNPDTSRHLVNYYSNAFMFKSDSKYKSLVPKYDWGCIHMLREVDTLLNDRDNFLNIYSMKSIDNSGAPDQI